MKKNIKKIIMLLALIGVVSPFNNNVFALDPDDETNTVITDEEPTGGEGEEIGGEETPTPTPTPTEDPKKSEAYLKNIYITGIKFNETFDKEVYKYTATVTSSTKEVKINVEVGAGSLSDDSDTKCTLSNSTTDCKIKVTSENGKVSKTYTVTINKATSNLNLKSLSIIGIPLNETFDSESDSYTAEVSYNVKSLTIDATPEDSECTVTVSSNASNLSVGKTTVKVTVKNKALESKVYKIVVNRLTEEESLGDDDNNNSSSILDDENNNANTSSNSGIINDIGKNNDENNNTDNNLVRNILISLICLLLLLIAGIGIYFFIVTGNSEKNRMRKIAKLKKKQAKIEEQLTGLMPVITEEQSNNYINSTKNATKSVDTLKYNDDIYKEDTIVVSEPEVISDVDDTLGNTIEIEIPEFEDDNDLDFNIDTEKPKDNNDNTERTEKNVLDDFDDLFDE